MIFERFADRRFVYFDGAMGTMLQRSGLPKGSRPDVMNILAPQAVADIHRAYRDAGSDILNTNTFGANADALKPTGYTVEQIVAAGVAAAREGGGETALVALDVGPLDALIDPLGDMTEERAYELFREQVVAGERAGADLIAIETMSGLTELSLAIRAARENTALPVFATMTFREDGRTYLGVSAAEFTALAEELGVAALGLNCSLAPDTMLATVTALAASTRLPLIVKPNAGLPNKQGEYDLDAEGFARQMLAYARLETVRVVGGCCGTTPQYITALKSAFERLN
ncbi:MAG: homocysteine S-methyltransferase family protein [Oscillospiraceae bacterium]|jgi:5-methyltetrahydrofolate--homocysteine methyltransferase|nr:homocysteine S-methyltransferase family protein [Oscillospiraceae bacterium]